MGVFKQNKFDKNRMIDLIIEVELTQLDVLQRPRESLDGSEVVLLQQHQEFTKEVRNKEKLKHQHSKFFISIGGISVFRSEEQKLPMWWCLTS